MSNEGGSSPDRGPFVLACAATTVAVLMAIFPLAPALTGGSQVVFDPIVALTALTVVGLIWYTYLTWQTLDHARRSRMEDAVRERAGLATGLLGELRQLSGRLKNAATFGPSAATPDFISHPLLELTAAKPALFSAGTVHEVANTLRQVRDVAELLGRYPVLQARSKDANLDPDERQEAEDERAGTALTIKTRASWAFNAVSRLVPLLEAEGGQKPGPLLEKSVALFESVPLLPDPFAAGE